jgi:hypothetical protein
VADRTAASAASPPAEMTGTSLAEIDFHFDIPNRLSWQAIPDYPVPSDRPVPHNFFSAVNNL